MLSTTVPEKLFIYETSELDHLFNNDKNLLMNRWSQIKDYIFVRELPKLDLKKLVNILLAHKLKIECLGSNRDHLTKDILNASSKTNLNDIIKAYISKNYNQNIEINNISNNTLRSIIK